LSSKLFKIVKSSYYRSEYLQIV